MCTSLSMTLFHFYFHFFFFKQKTAYEMRISDWSSDVCSSDLPAGLGGRHLGERQVDRARVAIGNAVEDREIALLDLAPLELPGEAAVRLRIAREQQTARGVTVEPMYGKRPAPDTETERKRTRLNSSHSCAARMPSSACKKKQRKN